jgi:large subunit ribosomal protein L22
MDSSNSVMAKLIGIRTTPRKVGLVADLIRGTEVKEALRRLEFSNKRFATPLTKLLKSAMASARVKGLGGNLKISEIHVGKGKILKRFRAGSRGSPRSILKYSSNVRMSLQEIKDKNGTKK